VRLARLWPRCRRLWRYGSRSDACRCFAAAAEGAAIFLKAAGEHGIDDLVTATAAPNAAAADDHIVAAFHESWRLLAAVLLEAAELALDAIAPAPGGTAADPISSTDEPAALWAAVQARVCTHTQLLWAGRFFNPAVLRLQRLLGAAPASGQAGAALDQSDAPVLERPMPLTEQAAHRSADHQNSHEHQEQQQQQHQKLRRELALVKHQAIVAALVEGPFSALPAAFLQRLQRPDLWHGTSDANGPDHNSACADSTGERGPSGIMHPAADSQPAHEETGSLQSLNHVQEVQHAVQVAAALREQAQRRTTAAAQAVAEATAAQATLEDAAVREMHRQQPHSAAAAAFAAAEAERASAQRRAATFSSKGSSVRPLDGQWWRVFPHTCRAPPMG